MGNALGHLPSRFSDQQNRPTTYDDYMSTYRQSDPTADHISYGSTKLQFGVKILQDVNPGPQQGNLYVVNPAGQRLYISHQGKIAPYAGDYLKQAKDYGNGPAVMITGTPLNPQYHMFPVAGGEMHHAGANWAPVVVNNRSDIIKAMTDNGMRSGSGTAGKYANYYGNATINPWGVKAGSDMWTTAGEMGHVESGFISALAVPVAQTLLDDVVPFGSTIMNVTGGTKALQAGINALAHQPTGASAPSAFDPTMANAIQDPRLPQYLANIQNRAQQFVHQYGPADYVQANQMAQNTPQQMLEKARALQSENENLYVQGQVQELQDTSTKLQQLLPGADPAIFQQIKTGLGLATNNEQKMNVISHFSKQIQSQLLPLLGSGGPSAANPGAPAPATPQSTSTETASAQVGHPILSINGTDSRHPGQTTIQSSAGVH